jgi:hypothetical protein
MKLWTYHLKKFNSSIDKGKVQQPFHYKKITVFQKVKLIEMFTLIEQYVHFD